MNYEKKYKEALEKAREIIKDYENRGLKDNLFYANEDFEAIFPELKESEDERIRKALIRFHKSTIDVDGIKGKDIIAWLEKPGNPNPYSGISFKHNGHTWGMCARDCGVDLMYDGKLRASFNEDGDVF